MKPGTWLVKDMNINSYRNFNLMFTFQKNFFVYYKIQIFDHGIIDNKWEGLSEFIVAEAEKN